MCYLLMIDCYVIERVRIQFNMVPVEAILTGILFPIVAWTNLEEEVTQVLSGHLNRNIDPLTRCVLACDDPSVTPGASYVQFFKWYLSNISLKMYKFKIVSV